MRIRKEQQVTICFQSSACEKKSKPFSLDFARIANLITFEKQKKKEV